MVVRSCKNCCKICLELEIMRLKNVSSMSLNSSAIVGWLCSYVGHMPCPHTSYTAVNDTGQLMTRDTSHVL